MQADNEAMKTAESGSGAVRQDACASDVCNCRQDHGADDVCKCAYSLVLQVKHFWAGLGLLLLRILALSLTLAYLMSLIDGLRTIGIVPLLLPFSALGQYHPHLEAVTESSWVVSFVDNLVYLYNCAFPGASRLGSGIGMIAACFWTLHTTPPGCWVRRAGTGTVAGALIGFRLTLMLTSSPVIVFSATIIGCLAMGAYMLCADRRKGIPRLPLISPDDIQA